MADAHSPMITPLSRGAQLITTWLCEQSPPLAHKNNRDSKCQKTFRSLEAALISFQGSDATQTRKSGLGGGPQATTGR